MNHTNLITPASKDYELLDSGENEKLERYGKFIVSRPDPQALWQKNLGEKEWSKADAVFRSGEWQIRNLKLPKVWPIELGGLKFNIRLSSFKHVGLFPEQEGNWEWLIEKIKNCHAEFISASFPNRKILKQVQDDRKSSNSIKVLNLFGYTGGATLAGAKAGAEVCHLDASKVAINWARENAKLSGLEDKPVRWILDDAIKFIKREIKRGRKYDGIVMDPPAFGHGPTGEMWKIEENFLELLDLCKQVLSEKPLFFLINGYASGYSAIAYENNLKDLMKNFKGEIEIGELTIKESKSDRLLPCGIYARWCC